MSARRRRQSNASRQALSVERIVAARGCPWVAVGSPVGARRGRYRARQSFGRRVMSNLQIVGEAQLLAAHLETLLRRADVELITAEIEGKALLTSAVEQMRSLEVAPEMPVA